MKKRTVISCSSLHTTYKRVWNQRDIEIIHLISLVGELRRLSDVSFSSVSDELVRLSDLTFPEERVRETIPPTFAPEGDITHLSTTTHTLDYLLAATTRHLVI